MRRFLLFFLVLLLFTMAIVGAQEYKVKQMVETFDSVLGWGVGGEHQGPKTAVRLVNKPVIASQGAAELTYDYIAYRNGLNYCEFVKRIQLPGRAQKLSFWVHADGSEHSLRIRMVDKTGETLQYNVCKLNWVGWREVSIDLNRPDVTWGGDGDKKPTYPIFFRSFLLDSKSQSFVGTGRIFVDEVQVETLLSDEESLVFEAQGQKVGNIYSGDEAIDFDLFFTNYSNKNRDLELSYWVNNSSDRILARGTLDVKVGANSSQKKKLSLEIKTYGTFNLKIYLRSRDRDLRFQDEIPFSRILSRPEGQRYEDFGLCTHFNQRKGDVQKNLDIAAFSTAGWIRDEMSWGGAEQTKGVVKVLPEWDYYVDEAIARGLKTLLIFDYGNRFYEDGMPPITEEGIAGYVRYCTTLTEHFKGRINHFEIWNEYNGGFGKGRTPEDYARMLKAAYTAIKEVNPDAVVIGGVTAGTDLGFIERVLKAGGYDYMDAVSIHPYSYPSSPDEGGFIRNVELTHELMVRYGGAKPIWITEIGWPTQEDRRGVSELMSGAYSVRMHILGVASGLVDKIFWYDLQNDGTDLSYNEDNFGLIRCWAGEKVPWSAKDNFLAYTTLNRKLAGTQFVREYKFNSNLKVFQFQTEDKQLLILWTVKGAETIGLKAGGSQAELTDILGNSFPLTSTEGVFSVTVSEIPIYFWGDLGEIELASSKFTLAEPIKNIVAGETTPVEIKLEGVDAGQFVADLPSGWQLVGDTAFPAGSGKVELQLKASSEAAEKLYEIYLYPVSGRNIAGRLTLLAQVTSPISVTVTPQLVSKNSWEEWQLALNLTNHSRTQKLSGALNIREPVEWSGQPLAFNDIGPGESKELLVPITILPARGSMDMMLQVTLASGLLKIINRPVSFLAAARVKNTPKIDGELNEWAGAMPFYLNDASQLKQIQNWGGAADLSGKGYLMWDVHNLYLGLTITDNFHVQNGVGSDIWQGDSIQFTIDPSRSGGPGSEGYHELGYGLSTEGVISWRWIAAYGLEVGSLAGKTQAAVKRTGNTTTYEVSIPWNEIVPKGTKLEPGKLLGFSLLVNENDGQGRRGWIEYMSGIGSSKDASAFGDLILVD